MYVVIVDRLLPFGVISLIPYSAELTNDAMLLSTIVLVPPATIVPCEESVATDPSTSPEEMVTDIEPSF